MISQTWHRAGGLILRLLEGSFSPFRAVIICVSDSVNPSSSGVVSGLVWKCLGFSQKRSSLLEMATYHVLEPGNLPAYIRMLY